jgi:hypothetical protein
MGARRRRARAEEIDMSKRVRSEADSIVSAVQVAASAPPEHVYALGEGSGVIVPTVRLTPPPKPIVGLIVHYYPPYNASDPARPRAAIITRVWEHNYDMVDLHVFGGDVSTGHTPTSVLRDDGRGLTPHRWQWPPRSGS